ncbi:MAG: GNAT family N-acetyltransferase [Deltaproteobacteria bacterium]|nr:GNAT family N-acetyltransferase [Deltaproteobacteria bacterium]
MERTSLLNIMEIDTVDELESIRDEWTELFSRCASATPFQSPQWLIPWWNHFGNGRLMCLTVRIEGRLAGIAPLYLGFNKTEKKKEIFFIGTGISDYLDFLFEPGIELIGTEIVFNFLLSSSVNWDRCDLQEIKESSPTLAIDSGLSKRKEKHGICPVLKLPGTFEQYLKSLPSGYRTRVRRSQKTLEKEGKVKIEKAGRDNLNECMDALFRLHRARWEMEGQKGVLADKRIQAFHSELAKGMLEAGMLRLYRLKLDGRDIAAVYGFAKSKRFYSYLGGFDPEFLKLSPGRVLMAKVIEDEINSGIEEFDFLRGEEKYKYVWGALDRINYRLIIER